MRRRLLRPQSAPLSTPSPSLPPPQIRRYPPSERADLTSPPSDAAWRAALSRYCSDVGCPHPPTPLPDPPTDAAVRDWLLTHAVGLAAADAGGGVAAATARAVARGREALDAADAAAAGAAQPPFDDAGDDATLAAVHQLADAMHVAPGPPVERAAAAASVLADRVAPAAALLGAGAPAPTDAVATMLAAVPLGFSTGDGAVDRAAAALRFLFVKDVARLQADVDRAIGDVQAFTANPRTDTRLGKVGR